MRAMQIIEWGQPLEARDYPDPEPKGEEVLLRVEAAGVCHSDVHIWDGFFDLGGGPETLVEVQEAQDRFSAGGWSPLSGRCRVGCSPFPAEVRKAAHRVPPEPRS